MRRDGQEERDDCIRELRTLHEPYCHGMCPTCRWSTELVGPVEKRERAPPMVPGVSGNDGDRGTMASPGPLPFCPLCGGGGRRTFQRWDSNGYESGVEFLRLSEGG